MFPPYLTLSVLPVSTKAASALPSIVIWSFSLHFKIGTLNYERISVCDGTVLHLVPSSKKRNNIPGVCPIISDKKTFVGNSTSYMIYRKFFILCVYWGQKFQLTPFDWKCLHFFRDILGFSVFITYEIFISYFSIKT